MPSQFPKPGWQRKPQVAPEHVESAFARAGHAVPHAPQFSGSVLRTASHPVASSPSQSSVPGAQLTTRHIDAAHPAVALSSAQTTPQPPQFSTSCEVSRQRPSHSVEAGATHMARHSTTPPELVPQIGVPPEQATSQLAQWLGLDRSASQPLAAVPSQSSSPSKHRSTWHAPVAHERTPVGEPQVALQPPQDAAVVSERSQPLAVAPSQFPQRGSHASMVHAPPMHAVAALGRLHRIPHAPQFGVLVPRSTQTPPQFVGASSGQVAAQLVPVAVTAHRGSVAPHTRPQLPQSVAVSTERSHPLLSVASQSS